MSMCIIPLCQIHLQCTHKDSVLQAPHLNLSDFIPVQPQFLQFHKVVQSSDGPDLVAIEMQVSKA